MKKSMKVWVLSASLIASPPAQADSIGDIVSGVVGQLTGGSGGLLSMIGMIPGLQFLQGVGPILDIVKSIPGFDALLSKIPGLGPILQMIAGAGGGADMSPLTNQINQLQKWMSTAQTLRKAAENLIRPTNYNDFASGVSGLLQGLGVKSVITPAMFKSDPQAAAKTALQALTDDQRGILANLSKAGSFSEQAAMRSQADGVQQIKSRIQRSADNAETLQKTTTLVKETQDRSNDAMTYTDRSARALKGAKKTEDVERLVGSAMLENLRVSATNSAALTATLANSLKVQVTTAETLGQMLGDVQQQRVEKAAAVANAMQAREKAAQKAAARAGELTKNLTMGMDSSLSASSLKGVDLLGPP